MFLKDLGPRNVRLPSAGRSPSLELYPAGLSVRPGLVRGLDRGAPRAPSRPPRAAGLALCQPGRAGRAERCLPAGAAPPSRVPAMEVLRRSSVFAAEIMDAFDRSPTDKELVAQAKALGREFVHARLLRAGLSWSAPERAALAPGGRLAEVCTVLLRLGECGARRDGSPDCAF